eukprot:scaffold8014_cov248-Pinguiococcus_pyrenoidosus.AAC.2
MGRWQAVHDEDLQHERSEVHERALSSPKRNGGRTKAPCARWRVPEYPTRAWAASAAAKLTRKDTLTCRPLQLFGESFFAQRLPLLATRQLAGVGISPATVWRHGADSRGAAGLRRDPTGRLLGLPGLAALPGPSPKTRRCAGSTGPCGVAGFCDHGGGNRRWRRGLDGEDPSDP